MPEIQEWRRLKWDGSNAGQLDDFTVGGFRVVDPRDRVEDPEITGEVWDKLRSRWAGVRTGQFVVCGVLGEFYVLDEAEQAADFDPALLASLPVPDAMAAGARQLAETGEAVLGRLGVKPDGRPGVSFGRDDRTRITITWGADPCAHTLLLERAGKALAVLGAMRAEWLCEACNTIHPHQKGDFISAPCPDCATWMTPTSPLLRNLQTEKFRREGAEAKLAEAVLMLGEVRETVANFLGQYGHSEIPMFKAGQDLANAVLKIIGADAAKPEDRKPGGDARPPRSTTEGNQQS